MLKYILATFSVVILSTSLMAQEGFRSWHDLNHYQLYYQLVNMN